MVDSAELFEAIAHTVRIKILKILEKQPASFASLKRQLGIDSSGNLDYHLKKLKELVTIREDGLYGLTAAGKEALLSIEAVELWTETEKPKPRAFNKMPKTALFLGLLEICSTVSLFWFFWAAKQLPVSTSFWGYVFFVALLLLGFGSGFGILLRLTWSWTEMLAKSALVITMSLFLLSYAWEHPPTVVLSPSVQGALWYMALVAAEVATIIVAFRRSLRDFLGIRNLGKLSWRAIVGGLLCMSNGVLLIILELGAQKSNGAVFTFIFDLSILCGLLIVIGGVLILLRMNTLGAAISIIFGLFPSSFYSNPSIPSANHVFDFVVMNGLSPVSIVVAVIAGSFPIVGGLLALSIGRRMRLNLRPR